MKAELAAATQEMLDHHESALFEMKSFDLELQFQVAQTQNGSVHVGPQFLVVDAGHDAQASRIQRISIHMDVRPPLRGEATADANLRNLDGFVADP